MSQEKREALKRKSSQPEEYQSKRLKECENLSQTELEATAGKIKRVYLRNFMCHESMEICFNPNVNFIVGRNGSGKSAILTALTIGLGARATITSRGNSMKEFIKKGKTSALIEITLANDGPDAFKPEMFGQFITVCRSIGASSSYKMKNYKGEIVSTKKADLEQILSSLNIQVDNPICVMNQDVSRSFLVTSSSTKKYEFFMKATRLDIISSNYKDSQAMCEESQNRLKDAHEYLADIKKHVDELEMNIEALESVETAKEEHRHLLLQYRWALVKTEEKACHKIEATLKSQKEHVDTLLSVEETKESIEKEINDEIKLHTEQISQAKNEVSRNNEAYNKAKNDYNHAKEAYFSKTKELHMTQSKTKRLKDDILALQRAVEKIERGSSEAENERHQMQNKLVSLEQELDSIQAMLRTKQTDKMHYEGDKIRLEQDKHSSKIILDNNHLKIRQIKQQLTALQQQSDNSLTVYGRNMPRLVRRIEEEYQKGKFQQKPRGPLGAYIKIKEQAWIPAVENFLGNLVTSFCTDNNQDAKYLGILIKEVFHDERKPQIISSRFFNKIHDVREQCTYSPNHFNLLNVMDISDPVVANCLIDQREIENVLLISTSQEACVIMSDMRKVPRNCKRAITQNADLFYPDPNYRTYGGKQGMKARFLQVSTSEAIQSLQEDLNAAIQDSTVTEQAYKQIIEKIQNATKEFNTVSKYVAELSASQHRIQITLDSIKDKLAENVPINISVYAADIADNQKKLKEEEECEKVLSAEAEELQKKYSDLNAEVKRARDLVHNFELKLSPIQDKIRSLNDKKENLRLNIKKASQKMQMAKAAVQKSTADLEKQKRSLDKFIANAELVGNRVETNKSSDEIERQANELKGQIIATEKEYGSLDKLRQERTEKKVKYDDVIEFANKIEENNKKQNERLTQRKKLYIRYKKQIGYKVQRAFESILKLRQYKGSIHIDHKNRVLELEVNPQNDEKRTTNDARSLSGGERSYSTVAFILALWDCTGLPFYFLDEFDVFMDKINRRIIMDILLDHTKTHPQSQFAFLTPLDTSNVLAEDYVTIHQLEPPERLGQEE